MLLSNNMFDVKAPLKENLGSEAIFATTSGSPANFSRDINHELCCSAWFALICQ
jgi:hypothetical protein